MTTAEAPTANPHQPVKEDHALRCAAEDCGYAMHVYKFPSGEENLNLWLDHFKRQHTSQHDPGGAPDITVDWEISACCSVCEDGIGDVKTEDSESVRCEECATTWNIDGTAGERAEADQ